MNDARELESYWETRSGLGRRAVGHIAWNDGRSDDVAAEWWEVFAPHLPPPEGCILDYGCGVGRFSSRLAAAGWDVTGADISSGMLRMAAAEYGDVCKWTKTDGVRLPFADNTFAAFWSVTVLQHIPDALFEAAVMEIRRVLKPCAFVLLFENLHRHPRRASGSGHVVFRELSEYLSAFDGIVHTRTMSVEGEEHALLVGSLGTTT